MPKIDIDYSNTIIYKIVCKDVTIKDIYVGHTTNFNERKLHHTQDTKRFNHRLYNFIKENGGFDNFEMIKIEDFPCSSKQDAIIREQFWITELKADLNTNKAYISKDEKKEYFIERRLANADKISEYQKNYYQENKERINLQRSLQRNEPKYKDKFNAYRREWRAKKKLEMQGQ